MLHELLLALQGVPGSIFAESEEGIQVTKGLTFLHPAEETILNRLCVLGSKYKELTKFIKCHKFNSKGTGEIFGSYARAFVEGLDEALKPYQHALWELELEILQDPHIALTYILKLEEYLPLFQHLLDVIDIIKQRKAHGCQILEIVYNYSNSGVPMIEVCMHRILNCCHEVLLRQLRHWMIEGILSDPHGEFFIVPEDGEYLASSIVPSSKKKRLFGLKPEMVPSYIPGHIILKILFVGQSVQLFDPDLRASFLERKKSSDFKKKEREYSSKIIKLLDTERFSLSQFAAVIDEIRKSAAEQMWKIVVDEGDLLSHIRLVKDFYLLGRGELFLAYIDQANKILKVPQTVTTLRDANFAFGVAAAQISSDAEKITEQFKITLKSNQESQSEVDKNTLSKAKLEIGWSTIGLEYNVKSPLHVIFTPNLLEKYNCIFRFLLAVRRVQIDLHHSWTFQMTDKNAGRKSSHLAFWQLRSHMAFLVDNLQYYLQVDVLESQFSALEHKVKTVKDFEAIQKAHENFVISIISQSFLHLKPVYHCLLEILDLCLSFCKLMKRSQNSMETVESHHFANFKLNFQRQTSLLFRILSGVRSHQASPHLAQLLLRIDYNKYLTLSGGHLGGPEFSVQNI